MHLPNQKKDVHYEEMRFSLSKSLDLKGESS